MKNVKNSKWCNIMNFNDKRIVSGWCFHKTIAPWRHGFDTVFRYLKKRYWKKDVNRFEMKNSCQIMIRNKKVLTLFGFLFFWFSCSRHFESITGQLFQKVCWKDVKTRKSEFKLHFKVNDMGEIFCQKHFAFFGGSFLGTTFVSKFPECLFWL